MSIDDKCINAIRFLAIDMVEKAQSGHPGAPMGAAAFAYTLWQRHLKHDPRDPSWPDRDRFVLSAGHASALLYALLHLTGYDLTIGDLKQFRQWGSRTPGHPEYGHTAGVETTTGPLGQGFANAVGMAMAEASLAARYNTTDHVLVDHVTYVLASDGDMQEGIASEAASLAGMQKLGKLIVLYDDNHIQIDGPTEQTFTEDVGARFAAYGWHVQGPIDGNGVEAVDRAIQAAKADDRPSLIACRTTIGFGSPSKADRAASHGAPLGADEVAATRRALGWNEPEFHVPDDVRTHMGEAITRGEVAHSEWKSRHAAFADAHADRAARFDGEVAGELPDGWERAVVEEFAGHTDPIATRKASGRVLNAVAPHVTALIGGSADLAGSNNTRIDGSGDFSPTDRAARNIHFGVREHAMASVATGMALHGGVIPYTGTFLVFSDYMRPAIRLAALMRQRAIYVFTHDSIGLGEDGPTHQPIEHLAALRAIPGLHVIRPGDAAEVAEAWRSALEYRGGPTAIVLTRQSVPCHPRIDTSRSPSLASTDDSPPALFEATGLHRGAYTVDEPNEVPEFLLLASGSEVGLALEAARSLAGRGVHARVVSMPCWELFREQPPAYQASVLPPSVTKRLAIEAGIAQGWREWVGADGDILSIEGFGASAPAKVMFEQYGFHVDHVVERAMALLERNA